METWTLTWSRARGGNQLFRNRLEGSFDDVTAESGAEDRGYGMGAAAGDYDNDGDMDLYVTNRGPNVLLRNDGESRFTDVTREAGVGDPAWSTSAAFLGYDADGDLDLYVANYIQAPGSAPPLETGWESRRETSMATGGSTFSSPTTARRISSG
jgi:hypothetical protein